MFLKNTKHELSKGFQMIIIALVLQLSLAIFLSNQDLENNFNEEFNKFLLQVFHFISVLVVLELNTAFSNKMFSERGYLIFSVPISSGKFIMSKYLASFIKLLLYVILLGFIIFVFLLPLYERLSFLKDLYTIDSSNNYIYSIIIPFIIFSISLTFHVLIGNLSIIFNLIYKGPLRKIVGLILFIIALALVFAYIAGVAYLADLFNDLFDYLFLPALIIPVIILFLLPVYLLNHKLEL